MATTTTQKMPNVVKNNIILRREIWPRVHINHKNCMIIFVGETGGGKSYGALRLGEILDPNFEVNTQVSWNAYQFVKRANVEVDPGTVDVLEEAGVAAGNRKWWELDNDVLDQLLQTWREQRRVGIMTVPELDLIDQHLQRRFHYYIEMIRVNEQEGYSLAKVQRIEKNQKTGKLYFKYPVLKSGDGRVQQYRWLKFRTPTEKQRKRYEAEKKNFTRNLNQHLLNKMEEEYIEEEAFDAGALADRIIAEGREIYYLAEYNERQYVDKDLLKYDFNLSKAEAKMTQKLLKRKLEDMGEL